MAPKLIISTGPEMRINHSPENETKISPKTVGDDKKTQNALRQSKTDFGMDFYKNGKILKLNETLNEGEAPFFVENVVFQRDGKLALV